MRFMANEKAIALGVSFLIISIFGYNLPIQVTLAETTGNIPIPKVVAFCDSEMGEFSQIIVQVAIVCSQYNDLMMGIYGSGILGIILIIVGAVIPSKSKPKDGEIQKLKDRVEELEKDEEKDSEKE